MRTRTTIAATAAALAALLLTACGGSDSSDDAGSTAKTSPTPTASGPTDAQKDAARAAAGLPPTPAPAQWSAYIKALDNVDADIVHGKEDKAVSRGISTCSTIKDHAGDTTKQVEMTRMRFTSPTHPEGRSTATATKILEAAHKYICPTY
ncbi:hypothetical protein [Streptomyces acidiscabies]|uniref:DUF732 domain-containing protein n=1 Tax=Streptomyces acidiscabies TaxID=42234 RepID=A0ABU4M8W1_9ACTN|nr:hypothetical protein [Streptomyces acidiscabies]MDX3024057.1 hypothetical protein [Streptomyces acidiscabies]